MQYLRAPLGLLGPRGAVLKHTSSGCIPPPPPWALHECRGYANLCNFIITLAQAVKYGILNTG